MEAILFNKISKEDLVNYHNQEELKFKTRELREDEFVQETSGQGVRDEKN